MSASSQMKVVRGLARLEPGRGLGLGLQSGKVFVLAKLRAQGLSCVRFGVAGTDSMAFWVSVPPIPAVFGKDALFQLPVMGLPEKTGQTEPQNRPSFSSN